MGFGKKKAPPSRTEVFPVKTSALQQFRRSVVAVLLRVREQQRLLWEDILVTAAVFFAVAATGKIAFDSAGTIVLVKIAISVAIRTHRGGKRFWDPAIDFYEERKLRMAKIIRRATAVDRRRDMRSREQLNHDFQVECLWLIANYVRSCRGDLVGQTIFANLIVIDPDDPAFLKVIARDREGETYARPVPSRSPRIGRFVNICFEPGGKTCEVDDLEALCELEHPMEYKSIVGLPITEPDGNVIGVVSIDSSNSYDFVGYADILAVGLQPYLELLRPTLRGWN